MRAALIQAIGSPAVASEMKSPIPAEGLLTIEMIAAALNPIDIAVADGKFYAGHPPLAYVPATEGVGRDATGKLVYVYGGGLGVGRDGTCAEYCLVGSESTIALPEDVDRVAAAALGTAGVAGWSATRSRGDLRSGDTVLVLGVTGTAGSVAAQAARLGGAARVIGVGRDPGRLARSAQFCDTVIDASTPDLAGAIAEAADGAVDLIVDFVWGSLLSAAIGSCALDARVVQVGAAAGNDAVILSSVMRGRRLNLLGYSNFGLSSNEFEQTYTQLITSLRKGELKVATTAIPLSRVAEAWQGTRDGTSKYVVSLVEA